MAVSNEIVEVRERLARIEESLSSIRVLLEERKDCVDDLEERLDQIEVDVPVLDQKIKNIKAVLWVFLVPVGASIARWFV